MGKNIRNSLGANEEHLFYFYGKMSFGRLEYYVTAYSHLSELGPGEESVLVDVKPPEGLLHPV